MSATKMKVINMIALCAEWVEMSFGRHIIGYQEGDVNACSHGILKSLCHRWFSEQAHLFIDFVDHGGCFYFGRVLYFCILFLFAMLSKTCMVDHHREILAAETLFFLKACVSTSSRQVQDEEKQS